MTGGTSTLREDSPATAKGSPHAGISAASFADSADSAIAMTMDATADGSRSVQFEEKDAQGHASDEEKEDEEYEEKSELGCVKTTTELLREVGELSLQVGLMGVPRPVERNLAAELGDGADEDDQGATQGEHGGSQLGGTESQLGGTESQLGEIPGKTPYLKDPKGGQPATNPSKIAMMKTPETKNGERFRTTAGTPYFEDSHMLSPKKSRTRLGRNKWESEGDNSAEAEGDSNNDHGYHPSRDETVKDQIYHPWEAGWPEGSVGMDEGMCDSDGNERKSEESNEDDSAMVSAAATRRYDSTASPRPRVVKLLRGERLGWWSSLKFDRRVRMRALVMDTVNDRRVKILLDTGANVSVVSSTLARKLRLKQYASRDQQIDIQEIGKDKVSTTHKALVKATLDWEVVYEFEVWIMPYHAGVDLILGTDFMIPAGIRLGLYNSVAKLPEEVTADGPTEAVCLSDRATAEFKLRREQPRDLTHEFGQGDQGLFDPYKANISVVSCTLPILVYESAIDKDLLYKEQELYADWLSRQPPAVERKPYHWPKRVKERPPEARKGKQLACVERWAAVDAEQKVTDAQEVVAESKGIHSGEQDGLPELEGINSAMEPPSECRTQQGVMEEEGDAEIRLAQLDTPEADLESQTDSANEANEDSDELEATDDAMATDHEEDLRLWFLAAAASASDDEPVAESDHLFTHFERKGETLHLENYAHELAFLPDLTEEVPIELDYDGVNSPLASPIVIVLKKNGVDIRLCIDYKKVNAITMIMEYAMPLVDDLLSELEKYLWFCSLDAASGFWAVMMTSRARHISVLYVP
ncbi:hypothetical protein PHPALM_31836 [Phytophthora palmivora]|uniref:Peptidase A2 domain-containing protein n=1 Tax=Phytophthora palmivora TaxID=4796 RepID=A0A2P4X1L3_9STRA|nr:hypothetical protein PHPALM_31836 [Phytophthora palmivora]